MIQVKFKTTTKSSPWQTGQSKSRYVTFRLSITCTETEMTNTDSDETFEVSTKIFAYMKTATGYLFSHVCSAVDLIEMPEAEGEDWCRKDSIDILFPSVEQAEEAEQKIDEEIRFLAKEIKSYTNMVGTREKEIF